MSIEVTSIWEECLAFIKDNIDECYFSTWFKPIKPISLSQDKTLTLQVPTAFFVEWLEEHYIGLLQTTLYKVLGNNPSPKLKYVTAISNGQESSLLPQKSLLKQRVNTSISNTYNPNTPSSIIEVEIDPRLNGDKNFDSFIAGESNRVAYNAALAIANKPGVTSFNPLFIFGGVGLGKTHLAHAIGLRVQENFPRKKILYIETENFTKQFIDATRRNQISDFIHFYQQVDVLIIDNIQFLSSKKKTQDAFFHIFSELHTNGKQIILTSDKAPASIPDIEERLLSRFKWGLSTELQRPELALRKKIFLNFLQQDGVYIQENVVDYIVERVKTNIRELEGVKNSLIAESIFNKGEITIELAEKAIGRIVQYEKNSITIDFIKEVVAKYFNISIEDLHSKKKTRHIAQARQLAMFFAKEYTENTLEEIGKQMKRNHSTVIYAYNTINDLKNTDNFKKFIKDLKEQIIL